MSEAELIRAIKAHIAKGEQHYISAGLHLAKLKERCQDQATFLSLVKDKIGIGKSRTYELLQIADGRKTAEEVRADTAERKEKHLSVRNGQKPGVTYLLEHEDGAHRPVCKAVFEAGMMSERAALEEIERAAVEVATDLVKRAPDLAQKLTDFTDDHWWPFVEALRKQTKATNDGLDIPESLRRH